MAQSSIAPIPEYLVPFLDYCEIEKGLSKNTQRNYRHYLTVFINWLHHTNNSSLTPPDLTADNVWDYRLYLARTYTTPAGNHLSRTSQNYYLIALRALLNYFADRDIETLPASKVKLAKQQSGNTITFLDLNDVEAMLAVPDTSTLSGLRDRAIMELFFSSGMRISELVALDVTQLSFLRKDTLESTHELSIVGKGNQPRTVFISPRASQWLHAYLSARTDVAPALFINVRSKHPEQKRLTARSIQMMINRCARLAGLSKKVTPHTLRHTYATDLLAHGADLRSVQELLGHKNVATTQVYTHVTNKQLRDIHERHHGGSASDAST